MKEAHRVLDNHNPELMGVSPIRLIIMAYDVAIAACEGQDTERAIKAVSILRDALNFDYPEAAMGLLCLYQWSLNCIRSGDYAPVLSVLCELRSAWMQVETRQKEPVYWEANANNQLVSQTALD